MVTVFVFKEILKDITLVLIYEKPHSLEDIDSIAYLNEVRPLGKFPNAHILGISQPFDYY